MSNLTLVKSEDFHGVQCDFWKSDKTDNYFMTIEQLAGALNYSGRDGIEKMIDRHSYLKEPEFSGTDKLSATDGKAYNTRLFTEDGIYEVTMLSKTDRAKEFRAKVRVVLKQLRQGTLKAFKQVDPRVIEAREKNAQARLMNARRKDAEFLISQSGRLGPQAAELVTINAIEMIAGRSFLPRPKTDKTYTAGDLAAEAGISANMIGRIATKNNLKTEENGCLFLDKSPNSVKQVESFRYNEKGRLAVLDAVKTDGNQ